jgi:hypothetical protein
LFSESEKPDWVGRVASEEVLRPFPAWAENYEADEEAREEQNLLKAACKSCRTSVVHPLPAVVKNMSVANGEEVVVEGTGCFWAVLYDQEDGYHVVWFAVEGMQKDLEGKE